MAGLVFERARAVSDSAFPGKVLVSRTVTDLVAGSGLSFLEYGSHALIPGGQPWRLFAVADGAAETIARRITDGHNAHPGRTLT